MTIADRARQVADAAPLHQSAAVLRECADALDAKDADLAALREAVGALRRYDHHDHCDFLWVPGEEEEEECSCGAFDANAALAAARKLAGLGE